MAMLPLIPELKVTRTGGLVRQKELFVLPGISPSSELGCFRPSVHNMLHAVAGRIFCVESNGKWSLLRDSRPPVGHSNSLQLLVSALEEMSVVTAPFERSEFPAQFRGRKRLEYERAVRELEVAGLDASDATIRMFLKYEKDVRSEKPNRYIS